MNVIYSKLLARFMKMKQWNVSTIGVELFIPPIGERFSRLKPVVPAAWNRQVYRTRQLSSVYMADAAL